MKSDPPGSTAASSQAVGNGHAVAGRRTAPVVVLSYGYSGARFVQQVLADETDLACTVGTGILPLCRAAAATWAQIDNRPATSMSQLAISSIRALVSTQLTAIMVASAGKRRWCELATSAPSAAQAFLQIFPAARFVCVHRACTDVISAAITAQSRGLFGPAISRFISSYPGNNIAAVAAYWASATEELLGFEAANPQATSRVRYDDVMADAEHALDSVRSALHLIQQTCHQPMPRVTDWAGAAWEDQNGRPLQVPVDLIPAELRQRIDHLHAKLGYPPA